jgi:hypothetical protein
VLPSRRLSLGDFTKPSPRDVALGKCAWTGPLIPLKRRSFNPYQNQKRFDGLEPLPTPKTREELVRPSMAVPISSVREQLT